jgi:hypothetical protein
MDQALCNDALNAAASNGSAKDWPSTYVTGAGHHGHPFWHGTEERGNISRRLSGQSWYKAGWTLSDSRFSFTGHVTAGDPADRNFAEFQRKYETAPFKHMRIRIPADDDTAASDKTLTEVFAAGFPYTFANNEFAMFNWRGSAALTHLVAASCDFGEDRLWTHSGRRAIMAARGAWLPADVRTRRYVGIQKHVILKTVFESKAAVVLALRKLFHAARVLERTPAVFGIPCANITWVGRHPAARFGVYDTRFVVSDTGLCYPAPGGANCWDDAYVYDFEVPISSVPVHNVSSALELVKTPYLKLRDVGSDTATLKQCPSW